MENRSRGSILWGGIIAVVAVVAALVVVGVLSDQESSTTGAAPPSGNGAIPLTESTTTASPAVGQVGGTVAWQSELDSLTVAPEGPHDGYDRDRFRHWIDADRNGCDTRCEVLARQRIAELPGLPDGGWLSIYDGYSTDDPSEFDVDHVVALSEAWDSGASAWDDARREAFANDLDSGQLLAVTAATNRSKSDRDPADWQPPNRSAWCRWGTAWVGVKAKWGLTADRAEVDALRNILRGCP